MQFVISVLKDGKPGPDLARYAIAQAFGAARGGDAYETRGAARAAELFDGRTPEIIRAFRSKILEIGKRTDLHKDLAQRMERMYGKVMPGLGPDSRSVRKASEGVFFVIGPKAQLDSWEAYLKSVQKDSRLTRLYPSDFWLQYE